MSAYQDSGGNRPSRPAPARRGSQSSGSDDRYRHVVPISRRGLLVGAAAFAAVVATRLKRSAVAVDWMWSGAVGLDEAIVVAKLDAAATSCRLKASTASDLSVGPIFSPAVAPDVNSYVRLPVSGLAADTAYYYGIEIDGAVDATRGRFRTVPAVGSDVSFDIAFGSCSNSGSNHRVFDAIRLAGPLLFAHLGDFHYESIATNDLALFRAAYEAAFAQTRREQLHREIANVYVWDDHDFGPNDSDGTSASRPAAAAVYRQAVPHFALPAGAGDNPIYQTFRIGRVRFIATDLRHQRSANSTTDDTSKTMMGATQKAWFKAQLDEARDEGSQLVVWLCSQVWRVDPPFTGIDTAANGQDHWGAFSTERAELANYIRDNAIPQVLLLGGDAHFVAFDDGTHTDYATGGGAPIVEFHASALDGGGSSRGTSWMSGVSEGGGRYGLAAFEDDGDRIAVKLRAIGVDPTTGAETLIREFMFHTASRGTRPALAIANGY